MSNNCHCYYIIINFKFSNESSRFMRVWRNGMMNCDVIRGTVFQINSLNLCLIADLKRDDEDQ